LAAHLLTYPWHILGCLLPWSPLLLRFAFPSFRTNLREMHDPTVFCATAIAATFPSVWFAFGATSRHFMSLYPCFAVLAAIVVDRSWQSVRSTSLGRGWGYFLYSLGGIAVAAGGLVVAAPWISAGWADRVRQSPAFTLVFAASALGTAGAIWLSLQHQAGVRRSFGIVAATLFAGFAYSGGVVNTLATMSEDTPAAVAELKATLPKDVKMVSLGEMDPLFVFHYQDPISVVAWPESAADLGAEVRYFSFVEPVQGNVSLPFAWETVASVSCERNRTPAAKRVVRVGRPISTTHGGRNCGICAHGLPFRRHLRRPFGRDQASRESLCFCRSGARLWAGCRNSAVFVLIDAVVGTRSK
jgi:hypothetical protein